jgi:hypothetical protein
MNPRSPFNANVRIPYRNGVLFFTNTQNKFNLFDFFTFTTGIGDPIVLDANKTLDVNLSNKPYNLGLIEGSKYFFNNPSQTTGHIMNLEFVYTETDYPENNEPVILTRLYARTELKLVVM